MCALAKLVYWTMACFCYAIAAQSATVQPAVFNHYALSSYRTGQTLNEPVFNKWCKLSTHITHCCSNDCYPCQCEVCTSTMSLLSGCALVINTRCSFLPKKRLVIHLAQQQQMWTVMCMPVMSQNAHYLQGIDTYAPRPEASRGSAAPGCPAPHARHRVGHVQGGAGG